MPKPIKTMPNSSANAISVSEEQFISGQPLHVRLYGRTGCHLCNDAAKVLNTLHSNFDFWVERVDIDQDPAIQEKLNDHIPVVTINGGNRVSDPVNEDKLRRAFKRALKTEAESNSTLNVPVETSVESGAVAV